MRDEQLERLLSQREWLRRFALDLVREPSLAEDVVQETWVAALRSPPSGDERSWLAAVARRAASFLRRSEGRRREREERAARPEATGSPAELVERIELEERLVHELRRLEEPFRATLLRRYFEGASAAEIARAEGLPEGTVRWRTSRGLAELRRRLAPALGEDGTLARVLAPLVGGLGGAFEVGGIGGGVVVGWKTWSVAAAGLVAVFFVARTWRGEGALAEEARARGAEVALAPARLPQGTGEPAAAPPSAREAAPALDSATVARSAVRVLDAEHRPLAGATVAWRVGADAEAVEATLDADGRLAFPLPAPATVELAIERPGHFPHLATLPLTPGEQELVLPAGRELSGRVTVDGGLPRRPLRLELFPRYGSDGRREARSGLFERDRIRVETDERGAFRFLGLMEDLYQLVLPAGHTLAGALDLALDPQLGTSLRLEVGGDHLIELQRFPGVRGRLVRPDGSPAEGEVTAYVYWDAANSTAYSATTDEAGEFELFFERPWQHMSVEASGKDGGSGEFEFVATDVPDEELGDLILPVGSAFTLRVLDEAGQPIPAAFTDRSRAQSDSEGRLVLMGVAGSVTVAAPGRQARSLQPPATGELDVVLLPGLELEIIVRDGRGQPVPEAPLRFEADRELFDGSLGRIESSVWRNNPAPVGRMRSAGNRKEGGIYSQFTCDGDGRWSRSGFLPGVPFLLRVGQNKGPFFHEERVAGLGFGERRRIEITLDATCSRVRGRAHDRDGIPLPGVRTSSAAALLHTHASGDCFTDWRGRFDCSLLLPIDAEPPVVSFSRIGFCDRELRWDLGSDEPREVMLNRGRTVAISLVDLAANPIPGGDVTRRRLGGESWTGVTHLAPGRFEAGGLEDGLYEFKLLLAGRETIVTQASDVSELVFRVARPGSVRLTWNVSTPEPFLRWLHPRLSSLDLPGLEYRSERTDTIHGDSFFRSVAPGRYVAILELDEDEERVAIARAEFVVVPGEQATVELEAR